jgi:rRNA maturation endonuclease Nob1
MVRTDPYTPSDGEYECIGCGHRTAGEAGRCPDCGADLKNISVPRE